MIRHPNIPGMSAYPELEKKFKLKHRAVQSASKCSRCEVAKVVRQFREQLAARQRRDKSSRGL